MTAKPTITWVNHASYVLSYENFSLMTDPWLFGSVFNKGWNLYAPTVFRAQDFSTLSHIWFSHEHPDHFSPQSLVTIPQDIREKITILFQKTRDRRVISYCEKLGFQVLEMEDSKLYKIQENIKLICKQHGVEDSFLFVDVSGTKILNLNDCVFLDRNRLQRIKSELGDIDCLLYQFSYAEKIGNPEHTNLRHAESKKWLQELIYQSKMFDAKYVIPFASYKYFSHAENSYMNDCVATPSMVLDAFHSQETKSKPVVLFPGDVWILGQHWDNILAVKRYTQCWLSKQITHSETTKVLLEPLLDTGKKYCKQIQTHSNPILLRFLTLLPGPISLSPIYFYVKDLNVTLCLNVYQGLTVANIHEYQSDILLNSESLHFFLTNSYGANTMIVNARYKYNNLISNQKLHNFSHLGLMIGSSQRLSFQYIASHVKQIVLTLINKLARFN